MKNAYLLFIGLLAMQASYASTEMAEEKALEQKIIEVENLSAKTTKEVKVKKSFLSSIREAKRGFREWKNNNPNHKLIRKEFKSVLAKIKKDGTPENLALKNALKECEVSQTDCTSILKSNIESIYTNSEIPVLAKKQGLSFFSNAYASGASVGSCTSNSYDYTHNPEFYAGLFGVNKKCGLTFFGPGLGLNLVSTNALVCVGEVTGKKVGVYATASGVLFGVGAGLLVGEGGICQLLSFKGTGLGAFAGLVITDGEKFSN